MKEEKNMKCLKICNGQAYLCSSKDCVKPLDKITKDDLIQMIDIITDPDVEDTFEIDDPKTNTISNEVHRIIYQNLSGKLQELIDSRTSFVDEANSLYKDAFDKYTK